MERRRYNLLFVCYANRFSSDGYKKGGQDLKQDVRSPMWRGHMTCPHKSKVKSSKENFSLLAGICIMHRKEQHISIKDRQEKRERKEFVYKFRVINGDAPPSSLSQARKQKQASLLQIHLKLYVFCSNLQHKYKETTTLCM
jgi:hypothetical protein